MKAKLTFDCDGDDCVFERHALTRALHATDAYLVLNQLTEWLRSEIKYGDVQGTDQARLDIYSEVRAKVYELMESFGVDLADLD